jgi:hypothetical protein
LLFGFSGHHKDRRGEGGRGGGGKGGRGAEGRGHTKASPICCRNHSRIWKFGCRFRASGVGCKLTKTGLAVYSNRSFLLATDIKKMIHQCPVRDLFRAFRRAEGWGFSLHWKGNRFLC